VAGGKTIWFAGEPSSESGPATGRKPDLHLALPPALRIRPHLQRWPPVRTGRRSA